MPTPDNSQDNPVQAFIARARTRWKTASEAESDNRKEAAEDLDFLNLNQWPKGIKEQRSTPGREKPCLTIDQIGEPFRQLTNKQRESRPAIHINPEDGEANQATADVLQGLLRAIEYDSDAQIAYATAFEGAVGVGWGHVRLRSEYDGDSDDQNLVVDMIENPFCVYTDPGARKWGREDARYRFIVQDIPKDEYTALYGESEVAKAGASLTDFSGLGDEAKEWFPEGAVRVAEYYYLEDYTDEKKRKRTRVMWAKINGLEILEGNDAKTAGRRIPGKTIPIRDCYGQVLNVNGKRFYRGIVRAAKDAQRQYNYQNSELVMELAMSPKAKVIMAEGQDEDHEAMWNDANIESYTRLIYKPKTIGNELAPPPQVAQFTDPAKIQSIVIAINQAKQDLRSTTGWYDATDPSRKNTDQSGKAILARKQSQDQGSINYLDNFNRFVTSLGKLMLEWIPEIYDRPGRIIRTLGMEDDVQRVMINQPYREEDEQFTPVDERAAELQQDVKYFLLNKGRYGVRVSPGTSYTTRKQEAAEWQFRLLEARPELMGVFGDIAFKNLDGPGHEQIAERIARTIPPAIKGPEEGKGKEIPPEVQQQVAAIQAQMQMMQQELAEKTQIIDAQQVKATYDIQRAREDNAAKYQIEKLKAEVAAMQARVELITAQASVDAELAKANLEAETKRLLALADLNVSMETETMRAESARTKSPTSSKAVN